MRNDHRRTEPEPGQESVWDYPRPPRLEASTRHIRILVADQLIADTVRAMRVLETSHPPVYYIPPQDIRMEWLRPVQGGSWCEWKGQASYFDVEVAGRRIERAAWVYLQPTLPFKQIERYLAFYPSKMDSCLLDGERVVAQEGDFYGGWITSEIVGPFKGSLGAAG